jgi:hypothetical protein
VGTTAGVVADVVVTDASGVVLVAADVLEPVDAEAPDARPVAEHPAVPSNRTLATSDAIRFMDRDRRRRVMRSESNDVQVSAGFTLGAGTARRRLREVRICEELRLSPTSESRLTWTKPSCS